MFGSKILNALENNCFGVSFGHLKLRRQGKKGDMKVGESKMGIVTG